MRMISELQRDIIGFFRATRYSAADLARSAGVSRELISALKNGYKMSCSETYEAKIRAGIRKLTREWQAKEGRNG